MSCVIRLEGLVENDGEWRIFGSDDKCVYFFAFDYARFFFSTTTLCIIFFNLLPTIYLPARTRGEFGPLCGDLPSLGGEVQGKRLQSVGVDACTQLFEGFFATKRLLRYSFSIQWSFNLSGRLSGNSDNMAGHACKRLWTQDAGSL